MIGRGATGVQLAAAVCSGGTSSDWPRAGGSTLPLAAAAVGNRRLSANRDSNPSHLAGGNAIAPFHLDSSSLEVGKVLLQLGHVLKALRQLKACVGQLVTHRFKFIDGYTLSEGQGGRRSQENDDNRASTPTAAPPHCSSPGSRAGNDAARRSLLGCHQGTAGGRQVAAAKALSSQGMAPCTPAKRPLGVPSLVQGVAVILEADSREPTQHLPTSQPPPPTSC